MNVLSEVLLLTGVVLLVAAFIFYRFPPKRINGLYGYRTGRSMKNQQNWDFAQRKSARLMLWVAALMLASGFLFTGLDISGWPLWTTAVIFLGLLFVSFAVLIFKVERALRNRFT